MGRANMTVTDLIERILSEKQICRNSDRHLIIAVWQALGLALTKEQIDKFMDLPSAETIRRVRQKLQENGAYLPDEKIRKHRDFAGMTVRQRMPTTKAKKVEQLITRAPADWNPGGRYS